jgi:c-di-GMP-related signal transduction protein
MASREVHWRLAGFTIETCARRLQINEEVQIFKCHKKGVNLFQMFMFFNQPDIVSKPRISRTSKTQTKDNIITVNVAYLMPYDNQQLRHPNFDSSGRSHAKTP